MPALSTILLGGGLLASTGAGIFGASQQASAAEDVAETQGQAAQDAAQAQVEAARIAANVQRENLERSLAFQQGIFDVGQLNLAPFLQAGTGAVGDLAQLLEPEGEFLTQLQQPFQFDFGMEDFQQDPGFQFRLQQGEQALNRAASARGSLVSGGQLRDLTEFGQGLASQEFGLARDRAFQEQLAEFQTGRGGQLDTANLLANLAGFGQVAGQGAANLGAQFGATGGSTIGQIGQSGAQSALQQGQALSQGLISQANAQAAGQTAQANFSNQLLGQVGQLPFNLGLLHASGLLGGG